MPNKLGTITCPHCSGAVEVGISLYINKGVNKEQPVVDKTDKAKVVQRFINKSCMMAKDVWEKSGKENVITTEFLEEINRWLKMEQIDVVPFNQNELSMIMKKDLGYVVRQLKQGGNIKYSRYVALNWSSEYWGR